MVKVKADLDTGQSNINQNKNLNKKYSKAQESRITNGHQKFGFLEILNSRMRVFEMVNFYEYIWPIQSLFERIRKFFMPETQF